MAQAMVSYSTGPMNFLVDKLTKLKNRPKTIQELLQDLVSLKQDFFNELARRRGMDARAQLSLKHTRELLYEIEDWSDAKPDEISDSDMGKIESFKIRIAEARELCTRYDLLNKDPTDRPPGRADFAPSKVTIDSQLLLAEKLAGLVGVDRLVNEILKLLVDEDEKMLKVVSIVGREGVGKTSLAKEISAKLRVQGKFDCQAFVSVGRRFSMRAILSDILHQVMLGTSSPNEKVKPDQVNSRAGSTAQDLQKVITELWDYLGTKRYFVLVDGLWDTQAWKLISSALPDKNHGSRVLTTTHIMDVARSCSMHPSDAVCHMGPLSEEYSRSLFVQSIPERDQSPAEFDEVSAKYVSMCAGMPLAITIVAGYLDSKSSELVEAKMPWESTEQYFSTLEGITMIQSILQMSYDDLALPVRSCFLYLSVFPEGYTIKKDRLIRLWLAEEFIPQERSDEESLWRTGERYFNELISRRLILPVFDYDDDQAAGCTVHGVVLDFIRSMASQENFVTLGEDLGSGIFPYSTDTIRRFSLDCYGDEDEADTLASKSRYLSSMRSLTVIGDAEWTAPPLTDSEDACEDGEPPIMQDSHSSTEGMAGGSAPTLAVSCGDYVEAGTPVLPSFKFMRVLDLEDASNLGSHHLKGIGEMVLLRYLGLGGTVTDELPKEISELGHLETLDVRRTKLTTLPSILGLKRLARLLIDSAVKVPSEIWTMQALEEVSTICIDSSSSSLKSFLDGVAGCPSLQSLCLNLVHNGSQQLLPESCFPQIFRRFEMTISGPILGGDFVHSVASFGRVTHLHIEICDLDDRSISTLGDLPCVLVLKLVSLGASAPKRDMITALSPLRKSSSRRGSSSRSPRKHQRIVIRQDGFLCLKVLSFTCKDSGNQLQFTPGAMPKLRRLWLRFSVQETLSRYGNFDFGIQHLTGLTRVHAAISCDAAHGPEAKAAEAGIREQAPQIRTTAEFSTEPEDRMVDVKRKKSIGARVGKFFTSPTASTN